MRAQRDLFIMVVWSFVGTRTHYVARGQLTHYWPQPVAALRHRTARIKTTEH